MNDSALNSFGYKGAFDWTSLLSPVTSLIGSIGNYFSTKNTNQTNQNINQQNLDYNAAMTREQWARDDTTHQREVADLEAAGLSPLANTSGSPVSGALSAPNPIAMQAPQIDTNSIVNSLLQTQKLGEEKRHNIHLEEYNAQKIFLEAQDMENKVRELDIQDKKVREEARHNAKIETLQAEANAELVANNTANNTLRDKEVAIQEYNAKMQVLREEIERKSNGIKAEIDWCDSVEEVNQKTELLEAEFKQYIAELGKYTPYASAEGESNNKSGGIGLGLFKSANANISGGKGESEHTYMSEDFTEQQKAITTNFWQNHKLPMLDETKAKRNLMKGFDYYYENNYQRYSR